MDIERKAHTYTRILGTILQSKCTGRVRLKKEGYGAKHLTLSARLYNPNDQSKVLKVGEDFALAAMVQQCMIERREGLIYFQLQLPEIYQTDLTRQDILKYDLPSDTIALGEGWSGVQYQFTNSAPHGLFAGTTGSGKTEAIKSTIVGLAQTYTPIQLGMLIVDGKKIDYGQDFNNLAHLVMPIAKDFNDYMKVIEYAHNEMRSRYRIMAQDSTYKPKRLVLIIDEVHDSEIIGVKSNYEAIKDIAKLGRSANVNLILGTQKPGQDELPKIIDMLINRFVGLVSDARLSSDLTGKKQLGAHLLAGEGDMLHVVGSHVKRCQICQVTEADYKSLPRAETMEPELREVHIPDDIVLNEPKGGRPENKISPEILGYYAARHPKLPTVEQSKKNGISYGKHKMHVDFWIEFLRNVKREKEQMKLNGGE